MANAKLDENRESILMGITDDSNATPSRFLVDPATGRLKTTIVVNSSITSSARGNGYQNTGTQTIYADTYAYGTDGSSLGELVGFYGILKNLFISVYNNTLNSGSAVFTLLVNDSPTVFSLNTNAGVNTTLSNTSSTLSVVPGDIIKFRSVTNAGSGSVNYNWSYLL